MIMPGVFSDPSERLLTERIPIQFFCLALVSHVLFWLGLGLRSEEVMGYYSADWSVLSVLHVLTVGVLLTVALGASLQMLPVALNQNAPKSLACDGIFITLCLGLCLLVCGFEYPSVLILQHGAVILFVAAFLYVVTVGPMLMRAKVQGHARRFLALSHVGLIALTSIGTVIALNYSLAFLDFPLSMTRAHAIIGGLGVMGALVLGFSLILVPMLALARPTATQLVPMTFACVVLSMGLGMYAAWAEQEAWGIAASVCFLFAALCHVEVMRRTLAKRMKDNLGTAFVLIRASWIGLVLTAVACVAATIWPEWDRWTVVIGWLALVGWLLTLLMGVLQRVIPFLASMNAGRDGGAPVPVSRLTTALPFQVHMIMHLCAVASGALALILEQNGLLVIAAILGCAGALSFCLAAVTTGMRLRRLRQFAT